MADPSISTDSTRVSTTPRAGIIKRIRLENFMCHSSVEVESGDRVNFITGQNGSGKSAILTALCVAFGSRARDTQRANTMKDFIKAVCSYSIVQVDIKNQGEDAFKPELYGDRIIVERRISDSASTITVKNSQGKKVGTKKDDLLDIAEHFNIDVDNPCVIMSQDKSRELLHSGKAKDNFKFFFKATLFQRVDALLKSIERELNDVIARVDLLEKSLTPALKKLVELEEKIKCVGHVEKVNHEIQLIRQKLIWSLVYDDKRKLDEKLKEVEKLKARKLRCQQQIDEQHQKMEDLTDRLASKKGQIVNMVEKTSEMRRITADLQHSYSMALNEQNELDNEHERNSRQIRSMLCKVEVLEQQIHDLREQDIKETQAEENELNEKIRELHAEVDEAKANYQRSKADEDEIAERMLSVEKEIQRISKEVEDNEKSHCGATKCMAGLRNKQTNKVTAFGGGGGVKVIRLLQAIERHHYKFSRPPIGPIGVHLKLEHGDKWSVAVENSIIRLLNAFIVTNHKDCLTLRACAIEASYYNLRIIIYDFSIPRLYLPHNMLPRTHHPTILSLLQLDNHTVYNVLIDVGSTERQVLVEDYDVGVSVVFEQKVANIKEAYTAKGFKLFMRGRSENIHPPIQNLKCRLCASFDNQIKVLEKEALQAKENAQQGRGTKRKYDDDLRSLRDTFSNIKRCRWDNEKQLNVKEFELRDLKKSLSKQAEPAHSSDFDELTEEISMLHNQIQEKQIFLEEIRRRQNEARVKTKDANMSIENMRESANSDIEALSKAEEELVMLEQNLRDAEAAKEYYEGVLNNKVLPEIDNAEAEYQKLDKKCKVSHQKALDRRIEDVGCKESTLELNAKLASLEKILQRERQKMSWEEKQQKIFRKQQACKAYKEKIEATKNALEKRWGKFYGIATKLARQLTWDFSGNLGKKGNSGTIKVDYEEQTLSIEVRTADDVSTTCIRDTRGLSGGERSFSTLCFALTLFRMTEAPFRAMDEFDVFMDAVSRKVGLDALVDFALQCGSQWIFITPYDISMVKNDERIKKQQMAAPRG